MSAVILASDIFGKIDLFRLNNVGWHVISSKICQYNREDHSETSALIEISIFIARITASFPGISL